MRRTASKLGKERTIKLIEQQREKQQFFDELMNEIEITFSKEEIQFFILLASSTQKHTKNKQQVIQTIKNIQTGVSSPSESNVSVNNPSQNQIKNIDLNLFVTLNKSKMKGVRESLKQEGKNRQDELRSRIVVKQKLNKNLFDVDKKMRENYQRIKHRIKYKGISDRYKVCTTIRNSNNVCKNLISQRRNRYHTQSALDYQSAGHSVPLMLRSDLPFRDSYGNWKRGGYCKESVGEELRWQCLGREAGGGTRRQNSTGCRRRYKIRQ